MNQILKASISFNYIKERCSTIDDLIKLRNLSEKLKRKEDINIVIRKSNHIPSAEEIVEEAIKTTRRMVFK